MVYNVFNHFSSQMITTLCWVLIREKLLVMSRMQHLQPGSPFVTPIMKEVKTSQQFSNTTLLQAVKHVTLKYKILSVESEKYDQ